VSGKSDRARDIFQRAIEIEDADERAAFLERECGGDAELRDEVESLLAAHRNAAGILDSEGHPEQESCLRPARLAETADGAGADRPGMVIAGRYKLLENIGEGGMGAVWVAEQMSPVKRRVAIKMIKAGMDSKQVLARFESERQALALMDHPNIAKVFDGGITEQGRPYFVMEYVKGIPFTDYCDQARVSLKKRLELFIPVCSAVQHAHQKGIIHRDLKPSNLLICLYDGKPVPKVIDFGLAKAMHQSLTDQSIYTAHGIMIGTPLYMSPEQAEHNNLDIDTRTDIYSLGVILYELLVGTTPLEKATVKQAAWNEVLRLIKEVDPPRPSTRLSGSAALPNIAAQRSIDPHQLRKSLAGDLDWIVMKALEKERSRRYETPVGLARDIERFLNDEAVEACPPSRRYRLKRLIRKHRGKFAAAVVLLSTLLAGIAATSWQAWRAMAAEHAALDSERKAIEAFDQATKDRDAKSEALKAEAAQRALAEQQREAAELNLIEGIFRPIGFDYEKLDAAESQSFIDWAALTDSRLKVRVLERALSDPHTALRLARRAERALQACIGVSPTRHDQVVALVDHFQTPGNTDPQTQFAATRLAMALNVATPAALSASIHYSATENWRDRDADIDDFFTTLAALAPKLDNAQAELALQSLIELVGKTTDSDALRAAGNGLAALAPKLAGAQTERAWQSLIELVGKTTDSDGPPVTAWRRWRPSWPARKPNAPYSR